MEIKLGVCVCVGNGIYNLLSLDFRVNKILAVWKVQIGKEDLQTIEKRMKCAKKEAKGVRKQECF